MKIPTLRLTSLLATVMSVLLMFTVLPVHATPMVHTYTGAPLTDGDWTEMIGESVIVRFTHSGGFPAGETVEITYFVISIGGLTFSSKDVYQAVGQVQGVSDYPEDPPFGWYFSVVTAAPDAPHVGISTKSEFLSSLVESICYETGDALYVKAQYSGSDTGIWTLAPVPVPPTALLLASGLIPLAWFRRRER
jgi:hypothetical protein